MEVAGQLRPPEREIYEKLWSTEQYRAVAPGEHCVQEFLLQAKPRLGATLFDLGCGTGRAGLMLALPPPMGAHLKVTFVDFTSNSLDEEIREAVKNQPHALTFLQHDLTQELPAMATYGFCTDVMEHIPLQDVNKVLNNCLMACQHVFFQIATVDDVMGGLVGHPLHLTVRPYEWWLQKFKDRKCVIHWSKNFDGHCMFYVSAWAGGKDVFDSGQLNISEDKVKDNVKVNVAAGWKQVEPYDTNTAECMIVGGGPTLHEFLPEIKKRRAEGAKLITLNGAYNWALENGLTPSATVIVDARAHNARFTKPVVDGCRYLICSQCDPSVLEGLPKERTYLWHTGAALHREILDLAYDKKWWPVMGGSTVLLRAIPLLRMLGYKRFHLYGCDSCVIDHQHHAYKQTENDRDVYLPTALSVGGVPTGKIFYTTTWQLSQAYEFMQIVKILGDEIELEIHGEGLLAYILRTGAEINRDDFLEEN